MDRYLDVGSLPPKEAMEFVAQVVQKHNKKETITMSERMKHRFEFTAEAIATAAEAEAKYHAERTTWWNAEYEKAAVVAKEKGVEIRHYPVTGGERAAVVIDTTVQSRLDECYGKRSTHQSDADKFRIEAATYGSQPKGKVYELDSDDVLHFRLAGGSRTE